MAEDKKKGLAEDVSAKENESKELSEDQLDEVSGGSIRNVRYTKTTTISADTKSKI